MRQSVLLIPNAFVWVMHNEFSDGRNDETGSLSTKSRRRSGRTCGLGIAIMTATPSSQPTGGSPGSRGVPKSWDDSCCRQHNYIWAKHIQSYNLPEPTENSLTLLQCHAKQITLVLPIIPRASFGGYSLWFEWVLLSHWGLVMPLKNLELHWGCCQTWVTIPVVMCIDPQSLRDMCSKPTYERFYPSEGLVLKTWSDL